MDRLNKQCAYKGTEVFYRVEGSGMPLVLVHGFGETGDVWSRQSKGLADHCRLIIPDVPGSGFSPYIPALTRMEDFADCLHAIVREEDLGPFALVGHSMGGYISLAYAEKYGAFLNGLGLFHSTAYADSQEKISTRRKSIEFIRQHGSKAFARQSVPNLFSEFFRNAYPQNVESLIDTYQSFDPQALIAYYEAMIARPDRTRLLRQFTGPVLFVIGEKDNAVPMQQALEQSHLPAISDIHVLSASGHMGMWEEDAAANLILKGFMELVADFERR